MYLRIKEILTFIYFLHPKPTTNKKTSMEKPQPKNRTFVQTNIYL